MARKEDSRITRRARNQFDKNMLGMFSFPNSPKKMLWYIMQRFMLPGAGVHKLEVWDELLKRYVNDPRNGVGQTHEQRTSTRGNLTHQLFSEEEAMSISTFMKVCVVVGAVKYTNISILEFPDGKKVVGKASLPLSHDVLMSIAQEDEEAELFEQVSNFINTKENTHSSPFKKLMRKLVSFKKKKENNNDGE